MLHHVPSARRQDLLLAEAARVLRPGGFLAGVDSLDSEEFRALHEGDVCVPVPPEGLGDRLLGAGFAEAAVEVNEYAVRFRATRARPGVSRPCGRTEGTDRSGRPVVVVVVVVFLASFLVLPGRPARRRGDARSVLRDVVPTAWRHPRSGPAEMDRRRQWAIGLVRQSSVVTVETHPAS